MPNYVKKALERFQYNEKTHPQYSPHEYKYYKPTQKGTQQQALQQDTSTLLDQKETKIIQGIAGTFLYYARALDHTMLPALNEIASMQAHPTTATKKKCQQLLDYANTYPNVFIRYHANDMVLHVDSDAAYLVAPKARSRIAGFYHLSNHPSHCQTPQRNGAIMVECKTLRQVVSSATEAETAALFYNARNAIPIRHLLQSLGHQQPPTPIKTDNTTALGYVQNSIQQKKSKSWDMQFHWLRDRKKQKQFSYFWKSGKDSDGDYFTKHWPIIYHRQIRPKYVNDKPS